MCRPSAARTARTSCSFQHAISSPSTSTWLTPGPGGSKRRSPRRRSTRSTRASNSSAPPAPGTLRERHSFLARYPRANPPRLFCPPPPELVSGWTVYRPCHGPLHHGPDFIEHWRLRTGARRSRLWKNRARSGLLRGQEHQPAVDAGPQGPYLFFRPGGEGGLPAGRFEDPRLRRKTPFRPPSARAARRRSSRTAEESPLRPARAGGVPGIFLQAQAHPRLCGPSSDRSRSGPVWNLHGRRRRTLLGGYAGLSFSRDHRPKLESVERPDRSSQLPKLPAPAELGRRRRPHSLCLWWVQYLLGPGESGLHRGPEPLLAGQIPHGGVLGFSV